MPQLSTPFGTFGAPPDVVAWVALALGIAATAIGLRRTLLTRLEGIGQNTPQVLVAALGVLAMALSAGYVAYYLRGGPRIIDATSYWLESRSFAAGAFDFGVPASEASFSGRFLLATAPLRAAVIFPPGYPAALAVFQALGVPLWLAPLLGAAIVALTYGCARRLFPADPRVAFWAAVLSVLSAAMRYHTADTMSHGFCATLWLGAAYCALRAWSAPRRGTARLWLAASGGCVGWLLATRPFTAVAAALSLWLLRGAWSAVSRERREDSPPTPGWVLWLAVGALPGAALWLWHQSATSGSLFGSSQLAYYALADGPPGCFGYGPGPRGCLYEHGDFVHSQLPNGFGLWQMLGTTARRLKAHLIDAGNLELFALAVPYVVWRERRSAVTRFLAGALLLQVAVYAPFYFDGNYPAGGARFFVDALPFEQLLLAAGIANWRLRGWVPCALLLGFALHSAYDHRSLRDREGGGPMFPSEAEIRARLGPGGDTGTAQVIFVDTDHGFNLGFDPSAFKEWSRGRKQQRFVARRTYDSREALLLKTLDAQGWVYDFSPHGNVPATWSGWFPPPQTQALPSGRVRLESEFDWPPREVAGGWVHPEWPPGRCVSLRRGLRFRVASTHPTAVSLAGEPATRAAVELVAGSGGAYRLITQWARMEGSAPGNVLLQVGEASEQQALAFDVGQCQQVVLPRVELPPSVSPGALPRSRLQVTVTQADFVLDWVELEAL